MDSGWDERFQRLQTVALIFAGLGLLLLVGIPFLTLVYDLTGQEIPAQLNRLLPMLGPVYGGALIAFLAVWIVFFGGCIASFLNVVAWRLPRGKSILGRSHCPQCHTQLTLRENLPIYGWLACGGRCRYCRLPIPARYFLVELAFGLLLLLVGCLEIGLGGWSLPQSLVKSDSFRNRSLFVLEPALVWIFASHVCLLSALYAYTLTRLESRKIPGGIFYVAVAAGFSLILANSAVAGTQWLGITGQPPERSGPEHAVSLGATLRPALASLGLSIASLGLGYWVGWFSGQLGAGAPPQSTTPQSTTPQSTTPQSATPQSAFPGRARFGARLRAREAGLVLGTVGVYLGLWSIPVIGGATLAAGWLAGIANVRGCSFSGLTLAATVLYLCCWRWLF